MFAKICFCLVNLWLWVSTAEGLPVNHALADFLHHHSETNSLVHQKNNVRFESQRYIPRYNKPYVSYPVFDMRSRSILRETTAPLASTTPLNESTLGFSAESNSERLLTNVGSTTVISTQIFHTTTPAPTTLFGEILSMRVSTSVTNSHRPGEGEEKPQVPESATTLYDTSPEKSDKELYSTALDTETNKRNNNVDTTQPETTTTAETVYPIDLTKSGTTDYYSYHKFDIGRTRKSSSDFQNKGYEQQQESKTVTQRILLEYVHSPVVTYGKPEENYEVSEEESVRSNGRTHGIQVIPSSTSTEKVSEAESETDRRKSSYVVEGRNYKKYRVEEETSDGFIVGEYGVFSHNDGSMRGVRYTAESNINPRLIYHALLKFLSLQ